jgi:hypothetical protein
MQDGERRSNRTLAPVFEPLGPQTSMPVALQQKIYERSIG